MTGFVPALSAQRRLPRVKMMLAAAEMCDGGAAALAQTMP
jgi:hypothetical protein